MKYHLFKKQGLQNRFWSYRIAHKDVLQKRLKLSGQRWIKLRLQQIAQPRVVYKNGKWNHVKQLYAKKTAT